MTRPRHRLTRLERTALIDAAVFVANEWPWDRYVSFSASLMFTADTLRSAVEKLKRSEPRRTEPGKERRKRAG